MRVRCPVCKKEVSSSKGMISKHSARNVHSYIGCWQCSGSGMDALSVAIEQTEERVNGSESWIKEQEKDIVDMTERLNKTQAELLAHKKSLEALKKRMQKKMKGATS